MREWTRESRIVPLIDFLYRIFARLSELGWDDVDYELLRDHPLVKKPQLLTDRIWNNIKVRVISNTNEDELNRVFSRTG